MAYICVLFNFTRARGLGYGYQGSFETTQRGAGGTLLLEPCIGRGMQRAEAWEEQGPRDGLRPRGLKSA